MSWWCDEPCDRCFVSEDALLRHLRASGRHPWYCRQCDRDFTSDNALSSHRANSRAHDWCTLCECEMANARELDLHRDSQHPVCCGRRYRSKVGWQEHARQVHAGSYCVPCSRLFDSPANYDAHLRSSTHAVKIIRCAGARAGCQLSFVSMSAMTAHLEAGTCASGMTRASLNARVARLDPNGYITTPAARRLITAGDDAPADRVYRSTSHAYDGHDWVCLFCAKRCRTQAALDSHLASPRHLLPAGKLYRCPSSSCAVEFATLSGLAQHIEASTACRARTMTGVQEVMRGFVGRTITY